MLGKRRECHAGRQPRLSWEQGCVSLELRAASDPQIQAGGADLRPARLSQQQRVSFDERTTGGGSGRVSAGLDSTRTVSDDPSSLSSAWQNGGSDRRSSGSGL